MDFIFAVLIAFSLSAFFGKISRRLGIPRSVGYIAAGIFLSNSFFGNPLFRHDIRSSFESLSSFGVLLLFFFAGLEINLKSFFKNLNESLSISFLNTVLPFIAVFFFASAMGYPFAVALILGLVMSVSGQAIIVDILDELGLLKSKVGNLIIDAGSVDDIVELIFLTVVLGIIGVSSTGNLIGLGLNLVLFAGIIIAAKLVLLPAFFRFLGPHNSPETMFGASLFIALLFAALSNVFGLGSLIGALLAGILVRQILSIENRKPWEEHKISNDIHLIGFGFFIPLFFFWVGYNTSLELAFADPFLVVALFALSFVLGGLGTWLGVRLNKGTSLEGFLVAVGMSVKGDAELAVSFIALQAGIISIQIFSVIAVIAIISSIIPPILFQHFIRQYAPKKSLKQHY